MLSGFSSHSLIMFSTLSLLVTTHCLGAAVLDHLSFLSLLSPQVISSSLGWKCHFCTDGSLIHISSLDLNVNSVSNCFLTYTSGYVTGILTQ